jgi:hypothetical protein
MRACRLVGLANRIYGRSFGGRGSKWRALSQQAERSKKMAVLKTGIS